MADIRFQFLINGEEVCLAEAEGVGIFVACLDWLNRSRESYHRARCEAPDDWDTTEEEWTRESLTISARTRDTVRPEYRFWFSRDLSVGDEVTIQILGPETTDKLAAQST